MKTKETTKKILIPEHIASGRQSWWSSITIHSLFPDMSQGKALIYGNPIQQQKMPKQPQVPKVVVLEHDALTEESLISDPIWLLLYPAPCYSGKCSKACAR